MWKQGSIAGDKVIYKVMDIIMKLFIVKITCPIISPCLSVGYLQVICQPEQAGLRS